jgi:hypothetical protein
MLSFSEKPVTMLAIALFVLVGIVHCIRLFSGWEITVNSIEVPMWVSVVGVAISAGLAYGLWWGK